jgi:hypothetical protein
VSVEPAAERQGRLFCIQAGARRPFSYVRLNKPLLDRARQEAPRREITLTSLIEQGLGLALRTAARALRAKKHCPSGLCRGRRLEEVINGDAAIGVVPQVLSSMARICNLPRFIKQPNDLRETLAFCNAILECPNATLVVPQDRHWSIFQSLCVTSKATGDLVPDA